MSLHRATLSWKNTRSDFEYDTYVRNHTVRYEGGVTAEYSSAKEYLGDPSKPNPEDILAASLSSCHMLTFLAVAAKSHVHVLSYEDEAVAHLEKNAAGVMCVTRVELHPKVRFRDSVEAERLAKMHEKAHRNCFISNSVRCEVVVTPRD